MKRLFRYVNVFAIAAFTLINVGCSFHSNQYEFISSLLTKSESGPTKNWVIEWDGQRVPVYAVNGDDYVVFVDEYGVQVDYRGGQITYAKGLFSDFPNKEIVISIEELDERVQLRFPPGEALGQGPHVCNLWRKTNEDVAVGLEEVLWSQGCSYDGRTYDNRKWLNDLGQLVRLEFLLEPGLPPVGIFFLKNGV